MHLQQGVKMQVFRIIFIYFLKGQRGSDKKKEQVYQQTLCFWMLQLYPKVMTSTPMERNPALCNQMCNYADNRNSFLNISKFLVR